MVNARMKHANAHTGLLAGEPNELRLELALLLLCEACDLHHFQLLYERRAAKGKDDSKLQDKAEGFPFTTGCSQVVTHCVYVLSAQMGLNREFHHSKATQTSP